MVLSLNFKEILDEMFMSALVKPFEKVHLSFFGKLVEEEECFFLMHGKQGVSKTNLSICLINLREPVPSMTSSGMAIFRNSVPRYSRISSGVKTYRNLFEIIGIIVSS